MRLELVPVPVTDIDDAITFYAELAGFADPDGNTWALQQLP